MKNFNQKDDFTEAANSLDIEPEDIPFEKYRALERENEVLKDVIVRLTVKIAALEKQVHPDIW